MRAERLRVIDPGIVPSASQFARPALELPGRPADLSTASLIYLTFRFGADRRNVRAMRASLRMAHGGDR